MPLEVTGQAGWGSGIYRGRSAPPESVYDAVNALVDDEGNLFRRGGSVYRSGAAASGALVGLGVIPTADPPVVLFWSAGNFYRLHADDSTITSLSSSHVPAPFVRGATGPTITGGSWVAPKTGNQVVATDGSAATTVTITPAATVDFVAAVGDRAVYIDGNKAWFTEPGGTVPDASAFHLLPHRAVGAEGIDADTLMVFTRGGVWVIENMTFDPVDDAGNIQHRVRQLASDVILWGDLGVTRWQGAVVVPALDDVYLVGLDGATEPVTEAIRPLYRSYVAAGYRPGYAATHRGHLFLPILNGTTLVDELVCRLDRKAAWTRWDGHGACPGYVRRVTAGGPGLLGIKGDRLLELTGAFAPAAANASEADGTAHACTITTRDYSTSGTNHPGTAARARLRYELADDGNGGTAAPAVTVAFSSDQDAGAFTTLTGAGLEASASAGGGVSDGSAYSWWPVGKKRERIRFRISHTGAAASFVLRTLELLIRQSGLR